MAFLVYILRDFIISWLFTEEFNSARDLFAIQLLGDVVKIASWLYAYPMLSRGATKWFVSSEIIFSILFVFLSYIFVSYIGLKGVPFAYLVNYIIYFVVVSLNIRKFAS